jgi:hypothetical protein
MTDENGRWVSIHDRATRAYDGRLVVARTSRALVVEGRYCYERGVISAGGSETKVTDVWESLGGLATS